MEVLTNAYSFYQFVFKQNKNTSKCCSLASTPD